MGGKCFTCLARSQVTPKIKYKNQNYYGMNKLKTISKILSFFENKAIYNIPRREDIHIVRD